MKSVIVLILISISFYTPVLAEETFHMSNADSTRTNRPESAQPLNETTKIVRLRDTKGYRKIYQHIENSRSSLATNKEAKNESQ